MSPHESEIGTQIGKALPTVPGHLIDQRSFSIDDFIMRERQNKAFAKRVKQAERHVMMVVLAMNGILRDVI
jgi:hypothetical protein